MLRYMIPALVLFALIAFAGCPGGGKGDKTDTAVVPEDTAPPPTPAADPVARGKALFTGTDYSNTGLTCAHCHAAAPEEEGGRIFIAHSAYGAASRGMWKVTNKQQLNEGKGFAATLIDAVNMCVEAPYMNYGEQKLAGEDAAAMLAYLESIKQPDDPFIIARATALPPAGLTPDMENGRRIYEQSCEACHDAGLPGLEELEGAGEWLNELQLMAKIRKLDDWYQAYEGKVYEAGKAPAAAEASAEGAAGDAAGAEDESAEDEAAAGAEDEEHGNSEAAEGEAHEGHEHEEGESHEEGEEEDSPFAENAMPFYARDILSDQEVVDVAFFIIQQLK